MRGWKQGDGFWQGKKAENVLISFLLLPVYLYQVVDEVRVVEGSLLPVYLYPEVVDEVRVVDGSLLPVYLYPEVVDEVRVVEGSLLPVYLYSEVVDEVRVVNGLKYPQLVRNTPLINRVNPGINSFYCNDKHFLNNLEIGLFRRQNQQTSFCLFLSNAFMVFGTFLREDTHFFLVFELLRSGYPPQT